MSTHGNERRSPSGAGDRQAAPAAGGEATPREAADVRALLRAVAAQIADVDRRHGDAAKQITAHADAMGQQIARVQGEVATAPRQAQGSSAGQSTPAVAAPPPTGRQPMPEPGQPPSAGAVPPIFSRTRPPVPHPNEARSAAPIAAGALAVAAPAALAVAAPAVPQADLTRLDARLAEVASRVEEALKSVRPEAFSEAVSEVGRKVEDLDARFGVSVEGLARRTDVEGLRIVEAHVTELASHIADIERQLGRLGGIEEQLRELNRFAEEARVTDTGPAVAPVADMPPALTLDDVRGLLDDTTRELGRHLADVPGVVGMQAQRVETLQRMIDAFVEERRQEDRHTAGMLDTMQQALIQLIDRIEQADLRLAPAAEPVPADFAGQFPHEAAPPAVAPVHEPMPEQIPEEPPRPFGRRAAEPVRAPAPVQAEPQAQAEGQPVAAGQEAPSELTVKPRSPKGDEYVSPKDAAGKPQPQIDVAALRAMVRAEVATTATTPAPAGAAASAPAPAPASSRGSRAPVMQSQAQPQPAAEQASTEAEGGAVLNSGVVRRGLAVVGVAFVLMGASALAHFYLSERLGLIRAPAPAAQATAPVEGMAPSFSDEDGRGRRAPAPRDDRRSSAGSFGTQEVTPATLEAPPSEREIRATRSAPAGITLQQPAVPLTPVELQRIQQRQYSAQASTHLGVAAGRPSDATEQQARLEPVRGEQAPVEVELTPSGELPPAMIGPLSLRLAAQQGEPGAEFEVASRFAEGKGVKADFKKAMEWYQRAAQKGFVPAQYRLGTLYERGLSGKPDLQRARVWYKRAAEQGNVKAMHNLAVLSAGRESGSPDYPNAAQWFQEAADRGLADSQFNLGVLYENGLGVPKDPGQAYKWYALASRSGDKEAIRRRDQMQARMDLADVKVADDMVASWRPRSVDARANDARAAADAWRERMAAAQPAPQNMAPPPAAQPAQAQPPAEPPKVRVMQGTPGNPGPPIR